MKKIYVVIISIIIVSFLFTIALFLDTRSLKLLSSLTSINEIIIKNNIALFNINVTPNDIEEYLSSEVQVFDGKTEVPKDSILKTNELLKMGNETYPIAVLGDVKGYFFNPMAIVGDAFFDAFVQHVSPQGWPGYFVFEGNILFGAKVVEKKAIFKLVDEVSA